VKFAAETSLVKLRAKCQSLDTECRRLRNELKAAREEIGRLREDQTVTTEQLERAKQRTFGPSTERRPPADAPAADKPPRKPPKGHGQRQQPGLPEREVFYELPAAERTCPCCGCERAPMGEAVEESKLITVKVRGFERQIVKRVKYKCACPNVITVAPGPVRLQKGGLYSLVFAVEVAAAKFAHALPLERQVQIMRHEGLIVDAQTLWDQTDVLAKLLEPTYRAIKAAILACPMIHCDETRWPFLDGGKLKENKTWQAWGLVSPELVCFSILDSRSKEAGKQVLGTYTGIVMADAYTVYTSLAAEAKTFVVANCWSHARRYFVECEKNAPAEAAHAIAAIGELFAIERKATPETLAELRDTQSRKIVDDLFAWARATQPTVLPRSGIGAALAYLVNQEAGLRRFLEDPRIPLSNNAAERALRGLVLGRKNFYGSRSRRGTEVAAIMYTLMECAKLAGISPKAYLLAVAEAALRDPNAVLMPADFKRAKPPPVSAAVA
jgi:transposase